MRLLLRVRLRMLLRLMRLLWCPWLLLLDHGVWLLLLWARLGLLARRLTGFLRRVRMFWLHYRPWLLRLRPGLLMLDRRWPGLRTLLCPYRVLRMNLRSDQIRMLRLRLRLRPHSTHSSGPRPRVLVRNLGPIYGAIERVVLHEPRICHSPNRRLRRRSMKRRIQWTIHRHRLRPSVVNIKELRPVLTGLTRMQCLRRQRRQVALLRCL